MQAHWLLTTAAITAICFTQAASASSLVDELASNTSLRYDAAAALAQPEQQDESEVKAPKSRRFGEVGAWWWSVGGGAAIGGTRANVAYNGYVSFDTFLAEDFQIIFELGGYYFDQDQKDGPGGTFNMMFRWHYINEAKYSVFASAGIGGLGATEDVPQAGTQFNFSIRAGMGATRQIGDGPSRLVGGVRWQHFSNANIAGSDSNPSTNMLMLYMGITFPF